MEIRIAERKKAYLRMAISGASNGGKTWSALEIAHGMMKYIDEMEGETIKDNTKKIIKIGMIDTEAGKGELYANMESEHDENIIFRYNVCRLDPPFSTERYIQAIQSFEDSGHKILITDSLSHAWNGIGGVLSVVSQAGKSSFQDGWKTGTPKHDALVDKLMRCKMHLICNMRAKPKYVVEQNEKGKHAPKKLGLAPIQRDQLEYEFMIFLHMDAEHIAHIGKDNSKLFRDQCFQPSPDTGRQLIEWLNSGISEEAYFEKNILPKILEDIHSIDNLKVLETYFTDIRQKYYKDNKITFGKIVESKDKKKDEINSMIEFNKKAKNSEIQETELRSVAS